MSTTDTPYTDHSWIELPTIEGAWYWIYIDCLEIYLEETKQGKHAMPKTTKDEELVQLDSGVYTDPSVAELGEMTKIHFDHMEVLTKRNYGIKHGACLFTWEEDDTQVWLPKYTLAKLNMTDNTVYVDSKFWEDKAADLPEGVGDLEVE